MKEGNKFSGKSIYGLFMVAFYVFIAVLLVFTSLFNDFIAIHWIRIVLGILFCAYAFFRGYRIWKESSGQ